MGSNANAFDTRRFAFQPDSSAERAAGVIVEQFHHCFFLYRWNTLWANGKKKQSD